MDCNSGGLGSNWGCEDDSNAMGAWLVDADSGDYHWPAEGEYDPHGSSGAWYDADDDKGWWPSAQYLFLPGEVNVTVGQEYHLQYGEAYTGATTSDNSGTTCADVYWKVGDCDVQASGR